MKPHIEIKNIDKGIQISITGEAPDTIEAVRASAQKYFEAISQIDVFGRAVRGHPHRNELVP